MHKIWKLIKYNFPFHSNIHFFNIGFEKFRLVEHRFPIEYNNYAISLSFSVSYSQCLSISVIILGLKVLSGLPFKVNVGLL